VILGTSHPIQDSSRFEGPVRDAIEKHSIGLVAEEYTCDTVSMASVVTKRLHIPYLQVDLYPQEWVAYNIDREMKLPEEFLQGQDVRLSHADAVREEFWLQRIVAAVDRGRVLVICGYLHLGFLAQKAEERGGRVVEGRAFPPELADRRPAMVLGSVELEDYVNKRDASGA
jgi:hypothetical protein